MLGDDGTGLTKTPSGLAVFDRASKHRKEIVILCIYIFFLIFFIT